MWETNHRPHNIPLFAVLVVLVALAALAPAPLVAVHTPVLVHQHNHSAGDYPCVATDDEHARVRRVRSRYEWWILRVRAAPRRLFDNE